MDHTAKELDEIKKRITETMTIIDKEKIELEGVLALLQNLSNDTYDLITSSASNSRSKRDKNPGGVKTRDEEMQELEAVRNAKQDAIGRMWEKLHDLQQEERDLEGKPRID